MKTICQSALVLFCLITTSALHAANPPGWTDDFEKAAAKAKEEGKAVLLDFTGSDWCGFCMALDKEVFDSSKFRSWAKKNAVLVKVDFPKNKRLSPKTKEQNDELKKKFPFNGYPTITIVDAEGKALGSKSGYRPGSGPAEYIKALDDILKKGASAAR
ncbi:MAG: thioredoxin family protein [Verrucomicrobiaceae bacterium]|nr:thioredoxin family protein [Verrucomicrobiaceae bacterium]